MTDAAERGLHGDVKHAVWKHFYADGESSEELTFSRVGLLLEHKLDYGDRTAYTLNEYGGTGQLIAIRWRNSDGTDVRREIQYDSEGEMLGPQVVSVTYSQQSGRKVKTELMIPGDTPLGAGFGDRTTTFLLRQNPAAASTFYDDHNRPVEKVYYNAAHLPLVKLVRVYDESGRVLTHEITPTKQAFAAPDNLLSPDAAMFAFALSSRTAYRYDEQGRLIEETQDVGPLSHQRSVREYNEDGDLTREFHYSQGREGRPDETGNLVVTDEAVAETVTELRFRYEYDTRGNWTLKEVTAPPADGITREVRTIEYFP